MQFLSKILLAFALLTTTMFAQNQVQAVSIGGTLKSTTADTLKTTSSPITAVIIGGVQTTGALGVLSFTTAPLTSGDFQNGGTFGAGGVFIIDAPGYIDYVGNFSSAVWIDFKKADGQFIYQLSGNLTSMEGPGSFLCQTKPLPLGKQWVTSAMESCSFEANLN